jgi:rhodanese-related sulfurtransferase
MQIPTVTVRDVAEAVLVDVREADEWAQGHAPNAVHLPMGEFIARMDELPEARPVNVICHVGGRSASVVAWLNQQGIDAVNVAGGMDAWEAAGLPIEI